MSDIKHYTLTVREVLQSLATLAMQYEEVSRGSSPTGNYFFAVNVADVAANLKAAQALILQLPYWIPVGERLPPLGEDVLLMCGDEEAIGGRDEDGDWWGLGLGVVDKPPTHWMPLPEPPEAT